MPPVPTRTHLFGLTRDELRTHCDQLRIPLFRADQVLDWVYKKNVDRFDDMTNLSQRDRALLADHFDLTLGSVVRHQRATDQTQKLLVDWSLQPTPPTPTLSESASEASGSPFPLPLPLLTPVPTSSTTQTESVLIPTEHRRTACISSQIGCPVGCKFCASGLGGLDGNLAAGQIVQQVWQLGHMLHQQHNPIPRVTNVVFMGMGEPLANFPNVSKALHILTAPWGLNISARKITVSTVGVAPGIKKLAQLDIPVTLAISLHAPNDTIRKEIIPWAKFVTIEELCEAGQHYFKTTGREVTLEYILLRHVNDRPEHARELADVAKKLRSNINLIRYNEVAGLPYQRPSTDDVRAFQAILQQHGLNTHIRQSRGRDIAAACGQLRHENSSTNR